MKTLRKNRIDYRHIVCIGITLGFIVLGVFRFSNALGRLIESIRDVGTSSAYYFCELFELRLNVTPTVNELPKIPFFGSFNPSNATLPNVSMPENWAAFIQTRGRAILFYSFYAAKKLDKNGKKQYN